MASLCQLLQHIELDLLFGIIIILIYNSSYHFIRSHTNKVHFPKSTFKSYKETGHLLLHLLFRLHNFHQQTAIRIHFHAWPQQFHSPESFPNRIGRNGPIRQYLVLVIHDAENKTGQIWAIYGKLTLHLKICIESFIFGIRSVSLVFLFFDCQALDEDLQFVAST